MPFKTLLNLLITGNYSPISTLRRICEQPRSWPSVVIFDSAATALALGISDVGFLGFHLLTVSAYFVGFRPGKKCCLGRLWNFIAIGAPGEKSKVYVFIGQCMPRPTRNRVRTGLIPQSFFITSPISHLVTSKWGPPTFELPQSSSIDLLPATSMSPITNPVILEALSSNYKARPGSSLCAGVCKALMNQHLPSLQPCIITR